MKTICILCGEEVDTAKEQHADYYCFNDKPAIVHLSCIEEHLVGDR